MIKYYRNANEFFNLPVAQRKHHIIKIGDMEFENGFGVRWDCHLCQRGRTVDDEQCPVCGPLE